MNKWSTRRLAISGAITALYVVLGYVFQPINFGFFQARIPEALTVAPIFMIESIPALTLGCLITNLLTGNIYDIVFGTMATFLAAILAYLLRNRKILAMLPAIVVNAFAVPLIFFSYTEITTPYWLNVISIAVGQSVVVFSLGAVLLKFLGKVFPANIDNKTVDKNQRNSTAEKG